jgi:hypothetical protein
MSQVGMPILLSYHQNERDSLSESCALLDKTLVCTVLDKGVLTNDSVQLFEKETVSLLQLLFLPFPIRWHNNLASCYAVPSFEN